MSYSLENLKKLREITEVGINDCMNALLANENDLEKSIQWLKEKSMVSSKSSNLGNTERINKFGLVKIKSLGNRIVSFCLKCESDFVSENQVFVNLSEKIIDSLLNKFDDFFNLESGIEKAEESVKDLITASSYSLKEKIYIEKINFFLKDQNDVFGSYTHHNKKMASFVVLENGNDELAREISMQIVVNNPLFISEQDIPRELFDNKIKEIREELVSQENFKGSAEIIEKIVKGKFNKWVSEVCLLEQRDFRNQSLKIKDVILPGTIIKSFLLLNIGF